ncbi:unnamed protein product [Ixodes persulcatus]
MQGYSGAIMNSMSGNTGAHSRYPEDDKTVFINLEVVQDVSKATRSRGPVHTVLYVC